MKQAQEVPMGAFRLKRILAGIVALGAVAWCARLYPKRAARMEREPMSKPVMGKRTASSRSLAPAA